MKLDEALAIYISGQFRTPTNRNEEVFRAAWIMICEEAEKATRRFKEPPTQPHE